MKDVKLKLKKQSVENGIIHEAKVVDCSELKSDDVTIITIGSKSTSDAFLFGVANLLSQNSKNKLDVYSLDFEENNAKIEENSQNLVENFAKSVIMPRLFKKNGKPYSSDEARMNMRGLNFLTYDNGSDLVEQSINYCKEQMIKAGVSENVCNLIFKNSFHMALNPSGAINQESLLTTVCFDEIKNSTAKRRYYFNNDENSYLGAGKFCQSDNKLCLVANNFVGEKQALFEEKGFGEELNNQEQDKNIKNIELLLQNKMFQQNSPRAQMLHKMMKRCLALSIQNFLENKYGKHFMQFCTLEEIELSLNEFLQEQNASLFENEQEKMWQYKNFGKPILETMEEFGITYHQLINGEVENIEEFLEAAQTYEGEIVEIDFEGTDLNLNMLILNLDQNNLHERIYDEMYLRDHGCGLNNLGIIMQDGSSFSSDMEGINEQKEWISDSAIAMKINRKPITNNIVYKLHTNPNTPAKNEIVIESGFIFRGENFEDVQDLRMHQVCSTNGDYELSAKQTRVILNLAIATKTPFENIKMPPQMMLNRSVLLDEMLKMQQKALKINPDLIQK